SKGNATAGATSYSFTANYGDQVTCTITNSRKAQVKLVKNLVPTTDGGKFDLTIGGTTFTNGGNGFGNTGTTGFVNVSTGSLTVSEAGHTGTSLSDYDAQINCDSSKGNATAGATSYSFTANYGDQVTCTITNHRLPQLKVVKSLVPSSDGGLFNLKIDSQTF